MQAEVAQFARDLVEMPTHYFEAKPQRIVRLGEFRGAVVPHDVDPKVLDALKHHGIEHVETYQRGEGKDRWQKVLTIAHAKDLKLSEEEW